MDQLKGRHALVTGGGRGIGAAIARGLTADGATVTIMGRDRDALRARCDDGSACDFEVCDVTDAEALGAAFRALGDRRGPIDILVSNAGAAFSAPFAKTRDDDFRRMLELNLMGPVHGARAVLPAMTERGWGRVVTVASTAALKGYAYVTAYSAAKHAVLGFTRALALETARSGITVNCVCPGFTDTDLVAGSVDLIMQKSGRSAESVREEFTRANPQGRLVEPREVASAVSWLCSPAAGSVTGVALTVAGGEI